MYSPEQLESNEHIMWLILTPIKLGSSEFCFIAKSSLESQIAFS